MPTPALGGCGVALVTPFRNDDELSLDEAALERLVNHVIAGGVDHIVVLGTTGESVTQSREECKRVLGLVHEFTAGRVPLVAGPFGGNSTAAVCERLKAYADVLASPGYVAVMSSVPSYVKPNQEGIYQHYLKLAEASPLPLLLYNVPGRTGVHMTATTTLRLAEASDRILGVKEASADLSEGARIVAGRPRGFQLLSGDDTTALGLIACGAEGVISVVANAYPKLFSDMVHAALSGDLDRAVRLNADLVDLHPLLYVDGNPPGVKAVLSQLGLCGEAVRLPLAQVRATTRSALHQHVLRLELARQPGYVT